VCLATHAAVLSGDVGRYQRGDQVCSFERDGRRVTIVEADGRTLVEEHGSPEMARTRLRILTNARLANGWKLVPATDEPIDEPAVVENARDPDLEAVILDDPENVQAWLVYGDWLQQQNDPRGTHIVLRIAAERDAGSARKLRKLEEQYGHYLHGGVVGRLGYGFVADVAASTAEDIDRAFGAAAGRFITRLVVRATSTSMPAIVDALGRHDPLALRHLVTDGRLDTVSPIVAVLARLRSLELADVVSRGCVAELASVPMPNLARLAVFDRGGTIAPLLARADLDALVDLAVEARLLDALLTSPIARRLERLAVLDLDDARVEHLIGHVARFWKLRELAIHEDRITPRLVAELEARVGVVTRLPSRYVPITE
jgi:uncharacterized protein (TIGR02996 family)